MQAVSMVLEPQMMDELSYLSHNLV